MDGLEKTVKLKEFLKEFNVNQQETMQQEWIKRVQEAQRIMNETPQRVTRSSGREILNVDWVQPTVLERLKRK